MGRKRKYNNSSVISIRISDEELEDLKLIMSCHQITRVSDLMRQAIELVKVSSSAKSVGSDPLPVYPNFH
ncbi:MAG TPA: ribbon-helix-helix protein, CopG family [Geobacteraceae bacterium]